MRRFLIAAVSICQGLLALAALIASWPVSLSEFFPIAMSIVASTLSLILAISGVLPRGPAWCTAMLHMAAIGVFCVTPMLLGGEALEGLQILVATGLILLVIGPPGLNTYLLLTCEPTAIDQEARSASN